MYVSSFPSRKTSHLRKNIIYGTAWREIVVRNPREHTIPHEQIIPYNSRP